MSPRPAWVLALTLAGFACSIGCQTDAERARELLEGPGAGVGSAARDALLEATTLDPTLREAWSRLADLELAASRWVEADAAAERAIALSDGSAHDHETRARALVALERWADAEPEIARELELGAPEAAARTRLGKVQEHLDRVEDAMASYRRAIEVDETSPSAAGLEARSALARLLITRLEEAARADTWPGDEATRREARALLEAARPAAAGTPLADEVTAQLADLERLDARAAMLAARQQARESGILAMLGPAPAFPRWGRDLAADPSDVERIAGGLTSGRGGDGGRPLSEVLRGERASRQEQLRSIGGVIGGIGSGGGGLPGGSTTRPGAVVQVTAIASGGLEARAVEALVRTRSLALRTCYERELVEAPGTSGTMRVELDVAPDGSASGFVASGLGSASLSACMSRVVSTVSFPAAPERTHVILGVVCSVP